jgi:methanogenic corrinoid protein MtbC1
VRRTEGAAEVPADPGAHTLRGALRTEATRPIEFSAGAETAAPSPHERLSRIVRAIEADIVPRLVQVHRPEVSEVALATPERPVPTALELRAFVELVLAERDAGWIQMVGRLRERGCSVEAIYLELLVPAAREVGRMWEHDRCGFGDVTVAVGRLQRIMRSLSPEFGAASDAALPGRRVLLVPAPGDQHTFGLSIVAEFFRRAGWEVDGGTAEGGLDPLAWVQRDWFDMVGISVGVDARLDQLKAGIAEIRRASCNPDLGVMVGGPIFVAAPERAGEIGADATASDGQRAPEVAERWLASVAVPA